MFPFQTLDFDDVVQAASMHPGIQVVSCDLVLYCFEHLFRQESTPAIAYACKIKDNNAMHTAVIFCSREDEELVYVFSCGSKFLENRYPFKPFKEQPVMGALADTEKQAQFRALRGSHPQNAPCNFWTSWRRDKLVCAHVSTALAYLRDQVPDFKARMEAAYNEAYPSLAVATV